MDSKYTIETYKTDVVIVGSEGAGATAAIELAKHNLDVIIVTKGNGVGRSGATITGEADLAVDSNSLYHRFNMKVGTDPEDSKENFFHDILAGGKYVNQQDIVQAHVEDAPDRFADLLEWGLKPLFVTKMSGHSYPRGVIVSAPEMIRIYRKKLKETKTKVLNNIFIHELLYQNGVCSGVFGLNMVSGNFITIEAKAVLLATGGGMRLYPITTAPEELTGDGTAMAFRAVVELMDMEFPMFLPGCFPWPEAVKGVNTPFKLASAGMISGHMLNKHGERFMAKWDPIKMEKSTRDITAVAMWTEIMENRGGPHGGVFVSLKHLPDNVIDYIMEWLPPSYLKKYGGFDMSKFLPDLKRDAVESVPASHFFNGGIKIDIWCRTNMSGLYAAGEVTAGLHGANRLSGNAFTDMIVWGHRAAQAIAEDIKKGEIYQTPLDKKQVEYYVTEALAGYSQQGDEKMQSVRDDVQDTAWKHAGIVRDDSLLKEGLDKLQNLKERYKRIRLTCNEKKYNKEFIRYLETKNMIANLECILVAAENRHESRGSHYRKDFPNTDNIKWFKNQVIIFKDGEVELKLEDPVVTTEEPDRIIEKYGY
ncbi:MAG: FAD-binding protein [Clostridiales bacterium]|nr:FAD-binding protein [Clostridiales bacterium]